MKQAAMFEIPYGENIMTQNWRWLPADSQQGTGVLSPIACKELNPANNHMNLEADLSSVELSDETLAPADTWLQPHERPWEPI